MGPLYICERTALSVDMKKIRDQSTIDSFAVSVRVQCRKQKEI